MNEFQDGGKGKGEGKARKVAQGNFCAQAGKKGEGKGKGKRKGEKGKGNWQPYCVAELILAASKNEGGGVEGYFQGIRLISSELPFAATLRVGCGPL